MTIGGVAQAYRAPTLSVHGRVVDLTAAGSSGSCEAVHTGAGNVGRCKPAGTNLNKNKG